MVENVSGMRTPIDIVTKHHDHRKKVLALQILQDTPFCIDK